MFGRVSRRWAGAVAAAVLVAGGSGGLVVRGVATAGAAIPTVVDAAIPDGDVNSLRDVLEDQITGGETVVLQSGATYVLDDCEAGDIEIKEVVTIQGNGAIIEQTCPDRVISTGADITLVGVTITGGDTDSDGGGIQSDAPAGSTVTIIDSTITGNRGCSEGGGLEVETNNAVVKIVRSTFSGNRSREESAIDMDEGGRLLIVNSTVTGNTSEDHGAIYGEDNTGTIELVYSTVVGNITGDSGCGSRLAVAADDSGEDSGATDLPVGAANISFEVGDYKLITFGSVIALPIGGPNCADEDGEPLTAADVDSNGYNFSDDTSCLLTESTDKQGTGTSFDPKLGTLASNGGPTLTRLPQTGSPLIDAIPLASCSGGNALAGSTITTDQRSLVRPDVVNQKCDIGAVEVQTEKAAPDAVVIQPTFTG